LRSSPRRPGNVTPQLSAGRFHNGIAVARIIVVAELSPPPGQGFPLQELSTFCHCLPAFLALTLHPICSSHLVAGCIFYSILYALCISASNMQSVQQSLYGDDEEVCLDCAPRLANGGTLCVAVPPQTGIKTWRDLFAVSSRVCC